jgi:NAD/NADP transhydrogenase alpha subunit
MNSPTDSTKVVDAIQNITVGQAKEAAETAAIIYGAGIVAVFLAGLIITGGFYVYYFHIR